MVFPSGNQNRKAARIQAAALRWLVRIAALLTAAVLLFLIGYILVMGIPNLKPSLFEWEYNSENVSLVPSLINTVLMTALLAAHRHAAGHLCRHLAGGVCPPRQQAGARRAHHHRDAAGHSLHRLRPVRHAVLRHPAALGLQPDRRRLHAVHHGAAGHHAHHGGSAHGGAGFLPRRQLRPGRRASCARCSPSCCPAPCRASSPASSWPSAASWARPPR